MSGHRSVDVLSRIWQAKHAEMAERGLRHGEHYVIPTSLPTLGELVTDVTPGNLPMGRLAVVGARTGNNKTRMLWNLAGDVVRQGLNIGFASLEVDASESTPAIWSILTRVPRRFLAAGKHYDPEQAEGVAKMIAAEQRKGSWGKFHLTSEAAELEGTNDVIGWMASMHSEADVRVFFVDYFQLLATSGGNKRFEELNDVVRSILAFIKATGALVFVASQFNRSSSHPKLRPAAESLDSCPFLERYAHFIWLLDHTRQVDDEHRRRTWLIVGKNRHGRYEDIPIEFDYRTHTVREALPDEVDRWPQD